MFAQLADWDKTGCLNALEGASDNALWDYFLEEQVAMLFEYEQQCLYNSEWWGSACRILEIGSGNGAYLHHLATQFEHKEFIGLDKLPQWVEQARQKYQGDHLNFIVGDIEGADFVPICPTDVVLCRLTLQHLHDAEIGLKNMVRCLQPEGRLVIIEACDRATRSSHPIGPIEEALALIKEMQKEKGRGNRQVSLDLLDQLHQGSRLSKLLTVEWSNLSSTGEPLEKSLRLEGRENRRRYFSFSLLFLAVLRQVYGVSIDLDRAYDELKAYLDDPSAWVVLGVHCLVLKPVSRSSQQMK